MFTFKKDVITISRDTILFFSEAKTKKSEHLTLYYVGSSSSRLGIQIPKKFLSLAVSRNSLRRSMRGFYRNMKHQVSSYDMLVVVTAKILAEKKAINDILLPEWKSLLNQLPRY